MEPRRLATRDPDLEGLEVLVVGCGRSGLAAAALAARRGARVTVCDRRDERALGERAERVHALGAVLRAGGHPAELAGGAELVVLSPGVPTDEPLVVRARELGKPVWGEIELATRFCGGRIAGITGSNGKSTVTTMLGAMLRETGRSVRVGGNLDRPLSELLEPGDEERTYVLELSSFQLETLYIMRPAVAAVLNLSPDHLDRHGDLASYARAKARLLELQEPGGAAILNQDDEPSRVFDASVRGRAYRFSTRTRVERGGYVNGGWLVLRTEHGEEPVLARDDLALAGEHNVANALAAAVAARVLGADPPAIARALGAYRALPHRLEKVARVGGVTFYDDSKATNPDSARTALESFEARRVHLILGGRDKGADWDALMAAVAARASHVWLVGEAASMLDTKLPASVARDACGTIAVAVERAFGKARRGDVVLLSPGCASFDQYTSFEQRGEDFRAAVEALPSEGGDDA